MKNVYFVSLGCDKNLVDSEVMLGKLDSRGYQIIDNPEEADIIVVNTCCFINDAKVESIETILEMAAYKTEKRASALLVAGCMAQKYKEEIMEEIPEVDAVIGTTAYQDILDILDEVLLGKKVAHFKNVTTVVPDQRKRLLTGARESAFLKIAEGCNKNCTYCMIPQVRGKYRSVPLEELLEQAREMVELGVKELVLVAQETTLYGVDLYQKKSLPDLLKALSTIEGLEWIRILYAYPEAIDDQLIETMASLPKVVHYLDLPIQHASNQILRKMGRQTTKESLQHIIGKLRNKMPDIVLRTTLITGFPGESQQDFEEVQDFIQEIKFQKLGVFTYSPEEETPAATYPDQIEDHIKEERKNILMQLQQEIAFSYTASLVDTVLPCIIEGKLVDEDVYVGRTYGDAPNVDGNIYIHTQENLMSGDIKNVLVTQSYEYDLIGELV